MITAPKEYFDKLEYSKIKLDKNLDKGNSKVFNEKLLKSDVVENLSNEVGFVNIEDSPLCEVKNGVIEYYAFPTLDQLKRATVKDYVEAGLGYRAEYMYDTIQKLTHQDLKDFEKLGSDEKLQFLLNLKGVGEKVAHCILLFACHDTTRFPVDTWINKVYNDLTNTNSTNRKLISKELTSRYGNLSGYAQQYFFYYYRENKIEVSASK